MSSSSDATKHRVPQCPPRLGPMPLPGLTFRDSLMPSGSHWGRRETISLQLTLVEYNNLINPKSLVVQRKYENDTTSLLFF